MIDNLGAEARTWWRALQPDPTNRWKGNAADRARLSRVATPTMALTIEATIDLHRRLGGQRYDFERVGLVAATLAHIRTDAVGQSTPGWMTKNNGFSLLRLNRLLSTRNATETMTAFRRLLAMMDRTANVAEIAEAVFDWDDRVRGNAIRRRWLIAFHSSSYSAEPATPSPSAAA